MKITRFLPQAALAAFILSVCIPMQVAEAKGPKKPKIKPSADIVLTVDTPEKLHKGSLETFVYTIENNGPDTAKKVRLSAHAPKFTKIQSVSSDECTTNKKGTSLRCTFSSIEPNEQEDVSVTLEVSEKAKCEKSVSYNGRAHSSIKDPSQKNNRVNGKLTISCEEEKLATLDIAVKALSTSDVAVENQKDITLLRFEGHAGETEDVLVTEFAFNAAQGNLTNVQNYSLWVDTDNNGAVDTILKDGIAASSGLVHFSDLTGGGYVIPAETEVVFEVHGDVSSNLIDSRLQLAFASDVADYVKSEALDDGETMVGIQTDGNCPITSCQINVYTHDSTLWTLVSQGDLYVTKDSIPQRWRQMIGGALSETALRMQFRAESEDIDVTDLQITVLEGPVSSIDRLELFKEGEVTAFVAATIGGCGSDEVPTIGKTYCANMESRQLVISEGENTDVLVRVRLKNDTNNGAVSGEKVTLTVFGTPVTNESTSEGAVRARGDISSNILLANDEDATAEGEIFIGTSIPGANSDISGNENTVVLSKIVSITNANPAANGTGIPVGISPIGQFKFSASNHSNNANGSNDVIVDSLIFTVISSNVDIDANSFFAYNKADSTTKSACTGTKVTLTVFEVECSNMPTSNVDTAIDQGSDIILVLSTDIVNPQVVAGTTSTLQVSLQDFDDRTASSFGLNDSHIRWLDKDNSASTEFFWIEYPETVINSTTYQS